MEKHLPSKARLVLTLGVRPQVWSKGNPLLYEKINPLIMVLKTTGYCTVRYKRTVALCRAYKISPRFFFFFLMSLIFFGNKSQEHTIYD